MARTGIYFSDVKRARDSLIASGKRPSIDAVRVELGGTGSKTTIHKYLRELEAEEKTRHISLSEEIQELIAKLAEQLRVESEVVVVELREQLAAERLVHQSELASMHASVNELTTGSDNLRVQLASSEKVVQDLQQQLLDEQFARSEAVLRSQGLTERLDIVERHQQSLEQKHAHAREALEHFRAAAKEQREHDARRHEQQMQAVQLELRQAQQTAAVKLEQLTQVNMEAASLSANLVASNQELHREKQACHALRLKNEELVSFMQRSAVLEAQIVELKARLSERADELAKATERCNELYRSHAHLETRLEEVRVSTTLEERISALQQAVFGRDSEANEDTGACDQ